MTGFGEWLTMIVLIMLFIGSWIYLIRVIAKAQWEVTLRDDTSFIGRRTWKAIWREGFFESAYQVIDSQNSPFKENMIVILGFGSILYRVRL